MASGSRLLTFENCQYVLPESATFHRQGSQLLIKVASGGLELSLALEAQRSSHGPVGLDGVANAPLDPCLPDADAGRGRKTRKPVTRKASGAKPCELPAPEANPSPEANVAAEAPSLDVGTPAEAKQPTSGTSSKSEAFLAGLETIPDTLPEPASPPSGEKENAQPPHSKAAKHCADTEPESQAQKQKAQRPTKSSAPPSKKMKTVSPALEPLSPMKGNHYHWKRLDMTWQGSDAKPRPRWGGTLTAVSASQAVMYGGCEHDGPLGDAWLLDAVAGTLQALPASDRCGKSWHSAGYLTTDEGRYVVVFGGEASNGERAILGEADAHEDEDSDVVSDTCMLDLADNPVESMWVDVPIQDERKARMPDRAGHSCTMLPDGRMVIFGGMDGNGKFHNDSFILDARRLAWFKLTTNKAPPKPRAYHSATLVQDKIVVLGGSGKCHWSLKEVYTLSIDNWAWKEHTSEVEGEAPCARGGHSAAALPDGRHLLVFGGGNLETFTFHSNISILDTHTWCWFNPSIQGGSRPSGRLGHAMVMLHPEEGSPVLLMHGGRTWEDQLCDDVWALQLPSCA